MSIVAACLKVQVGDQPPMIESVIDNFYGYSMNAPDSVSIDQAAVYSLLINYFMGNTFWYDIAAFRPVPMDYVFTYVGRVIDLNMPTGLPMVGSLDGGGEIPPIPTQEDITLACFNDYGLKEAMKRPIGLGVPLNWEDLVDETPANELQNLVDEVADSDGVFEIVNEPITFKIHRCTQSEIDSLFQGDHPPHVDMFDSVKAMLAARLEQLDDQGLAPAYYDAANDVIVFKSNHYVRVGKDNIISDF